MAYNSIMNTVYNHYLTTYAPKKTSSQYDTHKKSELRSIYNSMVKLNKDAPLYLFDTSKESREFAVGLKENARLLRNTIVSLGGVGDDEMFQKKTAYSSNPDMVDASYIGEPDGNTEVPSFTIEVTEPFFLPTTKSAFLRTPTLLTLRLMISAMSFSIIFTKVRRTGMSRNVFPG